MCIYIYIYTYIYSTKSCAAAAERDIDVVVCGTAPACSLRVARHQAQFNPPSMLCCACAC